MEDRVYFDAAMLSSAMLLNFPVLAVAEWVDLWFANVPNPIVLGQPNAIAWASNGSSTAATLVLRQVDGDDTFFDYPVTGG